MTFTNAHTPASNERGYIFFMSLPIVPSSSSKPKNIVLRETKFYLMVKDEERKFTPCPKNYSRY